MKIGYVYFAITECKKAVKIGVSKYPKQRISTLQTNTPQKLSVKLLQIDTIDEAYIIEEFLHKALAKHRLHGEWFSYNKVVRAKLKQFSETGTLERIIPLEFEATKLLTAIG